MKHACTNILNRSDIISSKIAVLILDNHGLSIKEVAQKLGLTYQTSHRYLRKLRERGKIYVRIEEDNVHRYYPITDEKEFFDASRSLLERIDKYKELLRG